MPARPFKQGELRAGYKRSAWSTPDTISLSYRPRHARPLTAACQRSPWRWTSRTSRRPRTRNPRCMTKAQYLRGALAASRLPPAANWRHRRSSPTRQPGPSSCRRPPLCRNCRRLGNNTSNCPSRLDTRMRGDPARAPAHVSTNTTTAIAWTHTRQLLSYMRARHMTSA